MSARLHGFVATLALAAVFVGCIGTTPRTYATSRELAIRAGVGTAVGMGILAGMAAASDHDPPWEDFGVLVASYCLVPLIATGILNLAEGLSGMAEYERDELARARARTAQLAAARASVREHAWRLTKDARIAARADDCAMVAALGVHVRDLDLEFHGTVFTRDVAIERCLDHTAPAAVSAPAMLPVSAEAAVSVARARVRTHAWNLTKDAAAAARVEDCAKTATLAVRVRDLDAEFHGTVLARDVAIQRCLAK